MRARAVSGRRPLLASNLTYVLHGYSLPRRPSAYLPSDREKDGVVRWRRLDLKRVIAERFGVDFHPRYVGKLLKKLGFSHISARPRHPAQDERTVEAFKKTSRAR
jgi:transposase